MLEGIVELNQFVVHDQVIKQNKLKGKLSVFKGLVLWVVRLEMHKIFMSIHVICK